MPVDKRTLHNIFDTSDDDTTDFFADTEDENCELKDISPDIISEDDLLPPAPILRNPDAEALSVKDINADIDFAIKTQANIINQSQQLIQIALTNAVEGNARDIEVASASITSATNAVEKLVALHEKIQKMKSTNEHETQAVTGNTFVQNQVVYQGTTSDFLEKLRNGHKQEIINAN